MNGSDFRNFPDKTGYSLDIPDELRRGEQDWNRIQSQAVGLYGHVSPLRENSNDNNQITAYRLEYWQFYAYNDAPLEEYHYEGDWETLQLVVEHDQKTIRRATHNVHGKEVIFEMTKGKSLDVETVWLLARDEANNESETNWDEVFAFQSDLEELLKKKVDLVSSEGLSRHVRPFVDRDKTLLYEKGE
jgi:hypothetical protein